MATKKKSSRGNGKNGAAAAMGGGPVDNGGTGNGIETTGRFVVIFKDEVVADPRKAAAALGSVAGVKNVASSADYAEGAVAAQDLAGGEAIHFRKMGLAIVADEDAVQALAAAAAADADSPIMAIEPEYYSYPTMASAVPAPLEYLRGYRDGIAHVYDQIAGSGTAAADQAEALAVFQDTAQFTWGLQATRVHTSPHGGQGVKVAVLDTGLDFDHPDFRGRAIVSRSFVAGVTAQDVFGHGTHCAGTACGPQRPATGVRRYGVAFGAQLHVGKVFDNAPRPRASTGAVIAGLEWAVTSGCRVVSLSLGIPIDQRVLQYELPMQRALAAGSVVVAAAGNNAQRPLNAGFVEPPANADAALAVAAVDSDLRIARFSGRSSAVTGNGGKVNLAAPGVAVFSSVHRGTHALLQGTSMATPHVAGIAALWAQSTGLSGPALWNKLLQTVRPLAIPSADAGAGLVQAPQ